MARSLARGPDPGSLPDAAESIDQVAGDRAGDNRCGSTEYRSSTSDLLDAQGILNRCHRAGQPERGMVLRTQRAILPGFLLCLLAIVRLPYAGGQLETSYVPVQATVSSEPVKMQANGHPEGIIHLDVAATDREGRPFSGLAAKDFTLTDNGVPQKIVSLAASNQPTNEDERLTEVVLVLDEVDLSFVQLELVKD